MITDEMKYVVVGGVVHFLIDFRDINRIGARRMTVEPGSIASFDLETEKWMPTLLGPAPVRSFVLDNNREYSYLEFDMQLSLADLQGCLVTVHNIHNTTLDLWYLSDFEKGLWVKKYSFPSKVATLFMYPLAVLDDGRIVLMHGTDILICFGTTTGIGTCDLLELGAGSSRADSVGIYTGSLLN